MAKRGRPNNLNDPENNSWCSTCQKEKPKTEFYKNRSRANGLDSRCKECNHANKRRRSKEKHKDEDTLILSVGVNMNGFDNEVWSDIARRRMDEILSPPIYQIYEGSSFEILRCDDEEDEEGSDK